MTVCTTSALNEYAIYPPKTASTPTVCPAGTPPRRNSETSDSICYTHHESHSYHFKLQTVSVVHPRLFAADPEPYHTSAFSGAEWVTELLVGHPELVLPRSGSEPWFEPEPFRTELMVRSKVRPRPRTEPLERFGVRLVVNGFERVRTSEFLCHQRECHPAWLTIFR